MKKDRSLEVARSRRRRVPGWAAVVAVALLLAAACGDDDDGGAAATTTAAGGTATTAAQSTETTLEPVDPLKITIGSASELYAATWVALGNGLFEKHGVEVEVTGYDGVQSGLAQLSADQIDLFLFTPVLGLNLAKEDIDVSFVYRFSDLDYHFASFATIPEITSFDQLKALGSDCRLATASVGTSMYAIALAFSEAYQLDCELVPQAGATLQVPALASGDVQAAVVLNTPAFTAAEQGVLNLLYDPRTVTEAEGKKVLAESYPHIIAVGKTGTLESKRESVVRFISALQEGSEVVQSSTPEELTEIAQKVEPFATVDAAKAAASWAIIQGMIPDRPDPGRITEDDWNALLQGLVKWGAEGIDPADPKLSYDAVVDMSYFDEAAARA